MSHQARRTALDAGYQYPTTRCGCPSCAGRLTPETIGGNLFTPDPESRGLYILDPALWGVHPEDVTLLSSDGSPLRDANRVIGVYADGTQLRML